MVTGFQLRVPMRQCSKSFQVTAFFCLSFAYQERAQEHACTEWACACYAYSRIYSGTIVLQTASVRTPPNNGQLSELSRARVDAYVVAMARTDGATIGLTTQGFSCVRARAQISLDCNKTTVFAMFYTPCIALRHKAIDPKIMPNCFHSARTVPVQCPYSARRQCP